LKLIFGVLQQTPRRPRTYREKARKAYLSIAKQRYPRMNQLRQAIRKQLQHAKRNLHFVARLLEEALTGSAALSRRQQNLLQTIRKLIEQQETLYKPKAIVLLIVS
jgi:hypothetical protein